MFIIRWIVALSIALSPLTQAAPGLSEMDQRLIQYFKLTAEQASAAAPELSAFIVDDVTSFQDNLESIQKARAFFLAAKPGVDLSAHMEALSVASSLRLARLGYLNVELNSLPGFIGGTFANEEEKKAAARKVVDELMSSPQLLNLMRDLRQNDEHRYYEPGRAAEAQRRMENIENTVAAAYVLNPNATKDANLSCLIGTLNEYQAPDVNVKFDCKALLPQALKGGAIGAGSLLALLVVIKMFSGLSGEGGLEESFVFHGPVRRNEVNIDGQLLQWALATPLAAALGAAVNAFTHRVVGSSKGRVKYLQAQLAQRILNGAEGLVCDKDLK